MSQPQPEPQTLKEKIIAYMIEKIQGGYKLDSKESAVKLKKMAFADLQIKQGNQAHVNDALRTTMEKLNLKFGETGGSKLVQGIKAKLTMTQVTEPTIEPAKPASTTTIPQTNLNGQQLQQPQSNAVVTQEMALSYKNGMKHLFGGLMRFYAKIGAIEAEDIPAPDKPMKLADYISETDKLAEDWADYCFRNNIKLPKIFEFVMLVVTSIMVLGSPMFSMMLHGRKGKSKKTSTESLGRDGDDKSNGNNQPSNSD